MGYDDERDAGDIEQIKRNRKKDAETAYEALTATAMAGFNGMDEEWANLFELGLASQLLYRLKDDE